MVNPSSRDDVNIEVEVLRTGHCLKDPLLVVNVNPKEGSLLHHNLQSGGCLPSAHDEIRGGSGPMKGAEKSRSRCFGAGDALIRR